MKKNAGFTLVELIVVIAILAVLAGIAIPVYSGYISKAQEAADLQQLDAIKTAAIFEAVDKDDEHDIVVNKITVTATAGEVKTDTGVTVNDPAVGVNVKALMGEQATITLNSAKFAKGAIWTEDSGWEGIE